MKRRYTLNWKPAATKALTEAWLQSADRSALARLIDDIDAQLAAAPNAVGESRTGVERICVLGKVSVSFDVIEADRRVDVLAVRIR